MADRLDIVIEGKPLSALRVVDLKQELEKRGLSKSGSKKDLLERLKLQLQLEKLQKQAGNEDRVPNLSLQDDEIAGQNEFIKQYLAGQQKIYEKQKEARRLVELEEQRASDTDISSQDEASPYKERIQNKYNTNIANENINQEQIKDHSKQSFSCGSNETEMSKTGKHHFSNKISDEIKFKSEDRKGIHYQSDEENLEIKNEDEEKEKDDIKIESDADEIKRKETIDDENLKIKEKLEINKEVTQPETITDKLKESSDDKFQNKNVSSEIPVSEEEDALKNTSDKNEINISEEKNMQSLTDNITIPNTILESCNVNIVQKKEILSSKNIDQDIEMNKTKLDIENPNSKEEKDSSSDSLQLPVQVEETQIEQTKIDIEESKIDPHSSDFFTNNTDNKIPEIEMAQGDDITETLLDKDIKKGSIPETPDENPNTSDLNYDNDKNNANSETDYTTKQVSYEQFKETSAALNEKEHSKSKPVKLKRKKLEDLPKSTEVVDNQNFVTKEDQKRKWNDHKVTKTLEKDNEAMEIDSKESNKNKNINSNYNRKTSKKSRSSSTDSSSDDDNHKNRERKGHNKRSSSSSSDSSESNTDKAKSKRRRIESGKNKSHNAESSDENNYVRKERRREHSNSSESSDSQEANRRWGRKSKNKSGNREERIEGSHYRSYGNRNYQSSSPGYRKLDQKYDTSNAQNKHDEHNRKPSPKEQKKEHKFSSQEETEVSDHREKQLSDKEIKEQSRRITTRKLSISSSRKENQSLSNTERPQRKRRWGSSTKVVSKPSVSISTDSLKDLIPDYKPVVKNVVLSSEELTPSANTPEEESLFGGQELNTQQTDISGIPEVNESDQTKEDPSKEESPHPPTPPQNPPSCIIHIKNLVRPFTLQQLKQVLQQTGTVIEEGFWIDKIKSKCYVTYETEDQASETRQALHGTRWPLSNPKTLIVDFATKEELDYHKELPDIPKLQSKEKSDEKKIGSLSSNSKKREDEYDKRREKQKDERMMQHPIREWDRDKLTQDSPEHDRRMKEKSRERGRSPDRRDKKDKKDSKRKQDDETPAKLLDDLFRKTKSTPCIYWLPLTEDQILHHQQQQKQRLLERERRRQQRDQENREREEAERLQRQKARENRSGKDKENAQQSRSPLGRKR